MTNPVIYQVRDLNNEKKILAPFIHESFPQRSRIYLVRIEKVIKRKDKKALAKWVGYSDKHNSWVPFSDLINI